MKERTNHNLSKTPYIDKYTTDLTEKIRPKRQDFVAWGRQDEIRQVFISLNRLEKNSPVLIGEAGVGKTAIVEGICADILNKKAHVPTRFQGKQVKQLELSAIQGKEFDHTGKEVNIIAKMDGLIKEFMAHKDEFILFIDEVHTIMGTGVEGSALDVANSLKPALSRGEIYLISATTADEFMIIERDPAMERRLQPVYVDELDKEASILVLKKRRPKYKRELDIEIPNDAIKAAVELSIRYVTDKMLPDKAIDIIDEASATANIDGKSEITLRDIANVIHRKKGIPMESLLRTSSTPVDFAEGMRAVVKGQDHVIRTIARLMYKGIQGGQNKRRPLGTLLLLGTTGTGKTELAKQAAKQLFGSEEAMIRLDMSEYMTDNAVVRLIGNDERKGDLTEKIKKNPYSLVLLDELEKAHPDVWALYLQMLDDGHLTDGRGRKINFKNTFIIATSNVGHKRIRDKYITSGQTFTEMNKTDYKEFMKDMRDELIKIFKRPEFINRWKIEVFYEYLSSVGVSPEDGARPLERTIDEVLTDEIFEQLYFLGRKPQDYFMVDVSLSGHAPGTFAYGNSGRKTVQDRRQTHISVKRIPPEEYGNYLLTS